MSAQRWQHAVVMGSGIAGLVNARILSRFFHEVVVIERDALVASAMFRPGVPQARHIHTLLARGRQLLEQWYPGLDDELAAAGVPLLTWGTDTRILTIGGYMQRQDSGISVRGHSRVMLEWLLRRRTQTIPNIRFKHGCEITGLLTAGQRVTGIEFMAGDHLEQVEADLIVDAMGRHSKSAEWLSDLGYEAPPETRVNPFLGYATRWYRLPPDMRLDDPVVLIQPGAIPGFNRGAAAGLIENGQVVITLAGMSADYPPTDEVGFKAFAASLPDPTVAHWITQLEPISPIYGYRAANRLRHYERLSHYPERLLVTGDATCTLNPVYGHGMTLAAMQAALLHDELERITILDGLARRFHRRLAEVNRIPWLLATGEDRRYPLTEGTPPNVFERIVHRYQILLFRAAAQDIEVARGLLKTMQLLMHPVWLIHPRIVLGALIALLKPTQQLVPAGPLPQPAPDTEQ
jgi:2-polyprenyl-6-methoxyphenol hydroxylase-like FAD-dependent oxidoreductase